MSQNVYIGMTLKPWPILLDHYRDVKEYSAKWNLLGERFGLPLPRKLIAASTSQFEKFQLRWKNKRDIQHNGFYAYVGSKPYTPFQAPSTRIASKAIQQLLGNEKFETRKLAALTNFLHKFDFGGLLRLRFNVAISSDDFTNLQNGQQLQPKTALILKEALEEYELEEILGLIKYCESISKAPEFLLSLHPNVISLNHLRIHEETVSDVTIDSHVVSTLLRAGLIELENLETVRHTKSPSNYVDDIDISDVPLTGLAKRSSGEQCLFLLFLGIISSIEDDALICIDEPEISLHPQWQEKFVDILKDSFSGYQGCHFLIATHSPLIVSDISASNCCVYDMVNRKLIDARPHKERSADYQLATLFHNPGNNNEYLITQIIEVLDCVCKTENPPEEILATANWLLSFESQLEEHDKVRVLLGIMRSTLLAGGYL
ncbi:AAA family ATPase [Shewanella baltica]|uniref:AAA family ATPase n=1 Tax=Shewanella baltica TaxID=62322 RepID=UPI003D7AA447